MELVQLQAATEAQRAAFGSQGKISNLATEFPEMITLNQKLEFDRFGFAPVGGHRCDLAAMRKSARFENSLIDNMYRMSAFLMLNFDPERRQLKEVHRLLDSRLGVAHATGNDD